MKKNCYIVILTSATIISSCITPKKIDKWVSKQYAPQMAESSKIQNDYIKITSNIVNKTNAASASTKHTSNVLPLIFYWQMDYTITTTLNPQIPVQTFISTALPYANTKGVKQKLNGAKAEFTIIKMPSVFKLKDKAHIIWLVFAFGWDDMAFIPDSQALEVSYRILKDNTETKTGTITIPNTEEELKIRAFQSTKKVTNEYLEAYKENITALSKKVIDKLLTEL